MRSLGARRLPRRRSRARRAARARVEGRRLPRSGRRRRRAARRARAAREGRGARRRRQARRDAPLPARPGDPRARTGRDRVRAAAARALDRARAARLRDRRRSRARASRTTSRRRDFTINAMARRLADGALVDPFGGRDDLEAGVLRTVSPRSFAEDPLRIVRGLRFVSQLGLEPDDGDARPDARGGRRRRARLGRADRRRARRRRDGRALEAAARPRAAQGAAARPRHRRARRAAPRVRAGDRVRPALERPRDDGRRAHLRRRPGGRRRRRAAPRAPRDALPRPRQARARRGREPFATTGAKIAAQALRRLRYPTDLREQVVRIVRFHPFLLGAGDALEARRMLARYGDELTFDLLDHWDADLRGRDLSELGAREARAASRGSAPSSSRSSRARTGSPTSPSTAPT